jgi:hypothetical protein
MSVFVRKLALWAVRPKRNTSKRNPEHKALRGHGIEITMGISVNSSLVNCAP